MYKMKTYLPLKHSISTVNAFWQNIVNSNESKISPYSDECQLSWTNKFPNKDVDLETGKLDGLGGPKSVMTCLYLTPGIYIKEDFLNIWGNLERTNYKIYDAKVYYKNEQVDEKYKFIHVMPFDRNKIDVKNMCFYRFSVGMIEEVNIRFDTIKEYDEYNKNHRKGLLGEFRYSGWLLFKSNTQLPEILKVTFNFKDEILFEKELVQKLPEKEAKKVFDFNKPIDVGIKLNDIEFQKEMNSRNFQKNKSRKSR